MFSDYRLLSPPQQELDRLDLAHKMMLKTLSGRLYLAPLEKDKVRRILDIGTGTGMCISTRASPHRLVTKHLTYVL